MLNLRKYFLFMILGMAATLLFSAGVSAQQVTGRILGTVTDASGAAVANAEIKVINQDTGTIRSATSGPDGLYNVPQVPAGTYSVEVTAAGFERSQFKNVTVTVGSDIRLDPKIVVGSVQQTVTVNETAPLVDTTTSSVGSIVEEQKVADLPLNGRNWIDLTLLQPGVTQSQLYVGNAVLPGANAQIFSSNGGTLRSNFYSLDGANMSTLVGFNTASVTNSSLGVDGIKEYKVVTSMFGAEYGMRMGSQTTIVSKGGTNAFHGDVFEYLRNSALDARNYFDALDTANVNGFGSNKSLTYPGHRLPPFRKNNFGGSFGGPIKKDKTFFYAVYEGIRQGQGATITSTTLPIACYVNGAVPAVIQNDACVAGSAATPITVNSNVLPIARLFPTPNVTGYPTFNYSFPYVQPSKDNYGQIRFDQNFSAADTFFLRYTGDVSNTKVAQAFPNYFSTLEGSSHFVTFSESHVISPTLLNTARFSYSRTNGDINILVEPASLNAPNVVFVPNNPIGNISPGSGISALGTACCPTRAAQDIFTLSDDVFWTKGRHAFKFGTLINHYLMYPNAHNFFQGTVTFGSLASFFNGNYSVITVEKPGSQTAFSLHMNTFGFYAQDDYRVASRLTLNLGLRYEFNTVPIDKDPTRRYVIRNPLTDSTGTQGPLWLNNSLLDFSPRLGFAWDVTGKGSTSVRGGIGVYYDIGAFATIPVVQGISNPPVSVNYQLRNTGTTPPPGQEFTVPLTIQANQPFSPREPEFDLQQPTMLQFNLTLQQQLPWQMGLTAGYAGSRARHLFNVREGNPVNPVGTGANGIPFQGCWNTPPPTVPPTPQSFVLPGANGACPTGFTSVGPRPNPAFGVYQLNQARGLSYYDSLQINFNKRTSHGLEFQLAYTWSKLQDTGQGSFSSESSTELNQYNNLVRETLDKGPASFDVAQNMRFNTLYHAPTIQTNNFLGKIVNGWWFSTIVSAQSGFPVTPVLASDRALAGATYQFLRPDIGPSFNKDTVIKGTVKQWFDPTMFSLPVAGTYGNAARGMLRGPGLLGMDFSVVKDTKAAFLGEQGNVQFRAEIFNIINHPNFALPVATVWSSGTPGTAAAGPLTTATAFATAGQISSTVGTSRQVQFALKVIF